MFSLRAFYMHYTNCITGCKDTSMNQVAKNFLSLLPILSHSVFGCVHVCLCRCDCPPSCRASAAITTPTAITVHTRTYMHTLTFTCKINAYANRMFAILFDMEDYGTTYRATRDSYLKAANDLKVIHTCSRSPARSISRVLSLSRALSRPLSLSPSPSRSRSVVELCSKTMSVINV
jgi:hypothetical protein